MHLQYFFLGIAANAIFALNDRSPCHYNSLEEIWTKAWCHECNLGRQISGDSYHFSDKPALILVSQRFPLHYSLAWLV